ncbi:MAG: hypothetical protein ACNA8R_12140 [Nitriliruptoraceae bacterium]
MGTTQQPPARWGPARATVTLGVLLSLLVAQLVTIGVGTATASPFDVRGELTFRAFADQADPTANELAGDARTLAFAVTEVAGNDVAIPGFHWLGEDGQPDAPLEGQGLFHLSCSQTISGTFAIALEGNEPGFATGTRLQITAFESTRAKDGRDQATCSDETFVALELEKSASAAEVAPGGTFAYTLTVRNAAAGERAVAALSVEVTDTIPAPFELGTLPAGCTSDSAAPREVTCEADDLAPGASARFDLPVAVPDPLDGAFCMTIDNTASAHTTAGTPLVADSHPASVAVTCDEPTTGTLTVAKVVEGPTPTGADGEPLPVTLVVACQQAEFPGEEPDISWTWMETVELVDGGSVDLEVADEADCWVEETDTLDAVRTTWRLDDDGEVEGARTDPTRVVPGERRTVTFTNTFVLAAPTPAIALVKTAVDADVPFTVDDGTLVLDVTGRDGATVTYDYLITNVGEETLVGLTLVDDLIGDLSASLDGVELAAGASITVTATYAVPPEQLTEPAVTNVATVTGLGLVSEAEVTASDDETVFLVDVEAVVLTTPQQPASGPEVLGTQLPRTGVDALVLTAGGLLLALLGVATVLAGRPGRRRRVA